MVSKQSKTTTGETDDFQASYTNSVTSFSNEFFVDVMGVCTFFYLFTVPYLSVTDFSFSFFFYARRDWIMH